MSHSKGTLETFWAWYQSELKKNPITTKALTSAVLSFTGNVVAQKLIERKPLDVARTIKFMIWGMIGAPIFHNWYILLDKSFRGKKGTKSVIFTKLLMDQLLMAPIANCIFYIVMAILNGTPFEAKKNISEQLWPTLKGNWKLWPAAQLINFAFVPAHLRSLFGTCVAFVWNVSLTMTSSVFEMQNSK